MVSDGDYVPIPCATYSRLELAAMHGERLRVSWRAGGVDHVETLRPRDLQTCRGEEFLIADTDRGEPRRIRLDHIRTLHSLDEDAT